MNSMKSLFRPNSLRFRLLASTALLVVIILPLTAFALTSYYRSAVEQTFDQRLKVHLDNLVVLALRLGREIDAHDNSDQSSSSQESEKSPELKVIELGEPRFKRPFSGWYWQIRALDTSPRSIIVSDSLLDHRITSPDDLDDRDVAEEKIRRGYVVGPEDQILRYIEQILTAGGDDPGEAGDRYAFTVAITSSEIDKQVVRFRNMLVLALGVLGTGLVLTGFLQVRYGLAPLDVISRKLTAIRTGKADHLGGNFPVEIKPLQTELNALIRSNRDIVDRARTHVGNLAHALKTPLSVMSNEIDKVQEAGERDAEQIADLVATIRKQTGLMNDLVRHHLDRARMAAQVGIIGNSTPIQPVMLSLARTLKKIYKHKGVQLHIDCPEDLLFNGEQQDLEEILGNLLDNAFKWARSEVVLSVDEAPDKPGFVIIRVDDDGPGLSAEKRVQAMQRGQRLDENQPGSGLGLSIVADLAHLYNGTFDLQSSPENGLRAQVELPVARS